MIQIDFRLFLEIELRFLIGIDLYWPGDGHRGHNMRTHKKNERI